MISRHWLVFFIAFLWSAVLFVQAAPPVGFQSQIVITNLTEPTALTFTPDGRMLIILRQGVILVVQPGAIQADPTPLLTLTNINTAFGERGLVGITLDPAFATNGYLYIFYTANSPLHDRVSRFTVSGNTASLASELVLWDDNEDSAEYHHGGCLGFGKDGKLYISTGDFFSSASPSQSLQSYRGKILRINPDGTIPTDNPFYDGAGPNLDAIWARGLRNPYRFGIDPVTGQMYIGDVGSNSISTSIEEINLGIRGANYGWPLYEGSSGGAAGMTDPIFSYPHAGHGACVSAGFVYHGTQFPAAYNGVLFYGDYAQSWIRYLALGDGGTSVTGNFNFEPADGSIGGPYGLPVDIKQGPDGSLYYVDVGVSFIGPTLPGTIRQIRYAPDNQLPVAMAAANPTTGTAPLTVNFTSAGSNDLNGRSLTYIWAFGDGTTSTLPSPTHTYTGSGNYTVRLSVSNGFFTTLAAPMNITVGTPPTPTILTPASGLTFRGGDVITYGGSAVDSTGTALPPSAFSWTILFLHENHFHPFVGPVNGVTSGSFAINTTGHDYQGNTRYLIILTVTDSAGLQNSTGVLIFPQKVNLTLNTSPPGLTVAYNGVSLSTPVTIDEMVGFQAPIEAPGQALGGTAYNFLNWSDGGAQVHTITVPATNQTWTATFQAIAPSGLVAAYNFNEGSGTVVSDLSGQGNNGLITTSRGGPIWVSGGRYGGALSFDGINDWVTVPDSPSLKLTTAVTMEAWVNPSTTTSWRTIMMKELNGLYYLYASTTRGTPGVGLNIGGYHEVYGPASLPLNTWSHVAGTYDGTAMRLYVNGLLVATQARNGPMWTSSNPLRIGGNTNWGEFFRGILDEVRIYNRALSQAEIQADMNRPILPGAP